MNTQVTKTRRTSSGDFVPQNAGAFMQFAGTLLAYITPARATTWNIPAPTLAETKKLVDTFVDIQQNLGASPSPAEIRKRNDAQKAATRSLRYLIQSYLRRKSFITNAELVAMGIPPIDTIRTPHIDVPEMVDFDFRPAPPGSVIVDFWQSAVAHSKAKPRGYEGAVFIWQIADEQPKELHNYHHHTMVGRRPHRFTFEEHERGKQVWFRAAWQNARGHIGEFSAAQSTFIG